ncbi:MAG: Ig-like domain repeat protein [Rhizobacter sp.]|nr:Ig-like domain repeat protein [Burkholderiales bacterium]
MRPSISRHILELVRVATIVLSFALSANASALSASNVTGGDAHSCAVTTGGGVQCWGSNSYAQLGDGTYVNRGSPAPVSGLPSGVASVAAGAYFTCVLTTTGGVKCWGVNYSGQLGDGTTTTRTTPGDVVGLTSGVTALAVGNGHVCAVLTSGAVQCWGGNYNGELGDSTTISRSVPTPVTGLIGGVVNVAAGANHSCALTTDGGVKCWGYNAYGQIGNSAPTTASTLAPADVTALASGVSKIALGGLHSCALLISGGMKCWGYNGVGALGNGTNTNSNAPVAVTGLSATVTKIAVGGYHTCAVLGTGSVVCWGYNNNGQLGIGTTDYATLVPTRVAALGNAASSVAAGFVHTCAIIQGSSGIVCWGDNSSGQVGDGGGSNALLPTDVLGLSSGVQKLAHGGAHACAVTATGGVKCWGRNDYGQLGNNTTTPSYLAVDVTGLTSNVSAVVAGEFHTCALTLGAVKCWGNGGQGQVGNGAYSNQLTPVNVGGLDSGVAAITTKGSHTCALSSVSGGVKCWGTNQFGNLGDGTTNGSATPVNVATLTSGVASISAGGNHTCATTTAGAAKCWGYNASGQLGDSTIINRLVPSDVSSSASGAAQVSAGRNHTCAINGSGALQCWGSNGSLQLGDNTFTNRLVPTPVVGLGSGVTTVTAGSSHSCALASGGVAKCWGDGGFGQLGGGNAYGRSTPTDVLAPAGTFAALSAGGNVTCGLTASGGAKCWGDNVYGQIGTGMSSVRLSPSSSVIGFAASVVSLTSSRNPSVINQLVTLTATIVGQTPTGTVTFKDGGVNVTGCVTVSVAAAQAVCSTSTLAVGSHALTADYSGDSNNPASASAPFNQVVNPAPAVVTITTSSNPSVSSQAVTVSATISGQSPTGTMAFYDGAQVIAGCGALALSGGNPATAACGPITTLANGLHTITATYFGDSNNGANQVLLMQTVKQSALAVPAMLASGGNHSCSISANGELRCWGYNVFGQLGDGSTANRASPAPVAGMSTGTQYVAAGSNHTCAINAGGGVRCWGNNYNGQVGDGSTTSRYSPVDVSGIATGAVAVAAGNSHSCALLAGGAVKCWGFNGSGQLGTGDTTDQLLPTAVSGLAGPVVAISAGSSQTCALLANGALQCWGAGRLGDGTTTNRSVPTTVLGLAGSVVKVSVGSSHICAVLMGGSLQCWGRNGNGQLGDGTTTERLLPNTVPGLSAVATISASGSSTCAVLADGSLRCWGYGASGKLGNGVESNATLTPQAVVGLAAGVTDVAVGGSHVCAMTQGGSVRCWGSNSNGQLGLGTFSLQLVPTDVLAINSGTVAVVAGGNHACALDTAGVVKCWGDRSSGQVGDGVTGPSPQRTPVAVSTMAAMVGQLSAGNTSTCVATSTGSAKCWGQNYYGELGDGTTTSRAVPGNVLSLTSGVSAVSAGSQFACALTGSGGVKCWGLNNLGQLGNGTTTSYSANATPVDVSGLASGAVAISAGRSSACAVLTTGGVQCWGDNSFGQLGDGTYTNRSTPVAVVGLSSPVTQVAVAGYHTCALMNSGAVKCWGGNFWGQFGQGNTSSSPTAVDTLPLGAGATKLSVGFGHTCAVLGGGAVKYWGYNALGQLADGTMINQSSPVTPAGLSAGVQSISAGNFFTCAFMSAGSIKCWGDNQAGQMGNGTVGYETTATRYTAAASLTRPLSVADSATVTASVDGAMIARYLAGVSGGAIAQGIDTTGALRTDATEQARYLDVIRPLLDIDGNTSFNPLTDGLLVVRYMLGMRGDALVAGAVGSGAMRTTAQIEAYLATLLP